MKARIHAVFLSVAVAAMMGLSGAVHAEQVTIVGPVTNIVLAKDGKSAEATLKDNKTGASVKIHITDDLTLDKFKDKRIQVGDEIRTRFEKNDNNLSKSFKKTAGC